MTNPPIEVEFFDITFDVGYLLALNARSEATASIPMPWLPEDFEDINLAVLAARLVNSSKNPEVRHRELRYGEKLIKDIDPKPYLNNKTSDEPFRMTDEQAVAVREAALAARRALAQQEVDAAESKRRKGAGPMLHN